MKLWVLVGMNDYEGGEALGVYDTIDAGYLAAHGYDTRTVGEFKYPLYDQYKLIAFEVGQTPNPATIEEEIGAIFQGDERLSTIYPSTGRVVCLKRVGGAIVMEKP